MAGHGFGAISLEQAVSFLTELSRGAWEKDDISALIAKKLSTETEVASLFSILKLDLHQTITAASQVAGSDLSVLLKKGDTTFDNLQARLETRLKLAQLEGDEETQRVASRCEEKLVVPGIRQMSYKEEVTNARLQINLATQDASPGGTPLRDDIALLGLTNFFTELKKEVDAFESLQQQSEIPPSLRIQTALRECARAFNNAYENLQRLERYTAPHSELAQNIEQRRAPFEVLLANTSASKPTQATSSTKIEPGKD